jgi:hypothetical protein
MAAAGEITETSIYRDYDSSHTITNRQKSCINTLVFVTGAETVVTLSIERRRTAVYCRLLSVGTEI